MAVIEWHVGDVVRKLRLQKGLATQEALARKSAGFNKQVVNWIETNQSVGPEKVELVAQSFGFTAAQLTEMARRMREVCDEVAGDVNRLAIADLRFSGTQLNSPSTGTSERPDIDRQTERGQDASAPPAHPQRSEGSMTREEAATFATLQSLKALPTRVQRKIFSAIDQYATKLKASSYPDEATSGKRRRRGGTA